MTRRCRASFTTLSWPETSITRRSRTGSPRRCSYAGFVGRPLGVLAWRQDDKQSLQKALTVAYDLALFDARWFSRYGSSQSGALKGTDVLADGLSKEDLVAWIKRIHEGGTVRRRASWRPSAGKRFAAKTRDEALVAVLDAVVTKVGLVPPKDAKEGATPPASRQENAEKGDLKTDPNAMAVDIGKVPRAPGSSDKMPIDDRGWSVRPNPPAPVSVDSPSAIPMTTEEAINIVLEDELIIPESNAPSPNPPPSGKHRQARPEGPVPAPSRREKLKSTAIRTSGTDP